MHSFYIQLLLLIIISILNFNSITKKINNFEKIMRKYFISQRYNELIKGGERSVLLENIYYIIKLLHKKMSQPKLSRWANPVNSACLDNFGQ